MKAPSDTELLAKIHQTHNHKNFKLGNKKMNKLVRHFTEEDTQGTGPRKDTPHHVASGKHTFKQDFAPACWNAEAQVAGNPKHPFCATGNAK